MSATDIINVITICIFGVAIFFYGVLAGLHWAGRSPADAKPKADEKSKEDGK